MNISFDLKLKMLSDFHRENCAPYRRLCEGLSQEMPFLPVSVFKEMDLKSVPEEKIVTCLTSSGTTGQRPSKIYLDAETAAAQQLALSRIAAGFLSDAERLSRDEAGELSKARDGGRFHRMPMLIIDTPEVLKKRGEYSARAAGITGFSVLSTRRYYALDENYEINEEVLRRFLEETAGKPFFAFGFTWIIWKYFYEPLKNSKKMIDLSGGYLIHGGGWKKMQEQSVTPEAFREGIFGVSGIKRISDYYGMAEQTGSIFMECECGHLHASDYSDIHFLRPTDFSECDRLEPGLIAVDSLLPKSYPGHRILTEDMGYLAGEDDCPCGRGGMYFHVTGRMPRAELRGCSDTFTEQPQKAVLSDLRRRNPEQDVTADLADSVSVLAGKFPVTSARRPLFDELVMDCLESLSAYIRQLSDRETATEVKAFGFWCRRQHLERFRKRLADPMYRRGLGNVFHIAPSNMPVMFAYSWVVSLLAGNANVVRVSEKQFNETDVLISCIDQVLKEERFQALRQENAFVRFPRNDAFLQEMAKECDACMIWGGDTTVAHMSELLADKKLIAFPDKYSVCCISAKWVCECEDGTLRMAAIRFCQDAYTEDQNACSSPHTVFWFQEDLSDNRMHTAKKRWWDAVAKEAVRYPLDAHRIMEKYRKLCLYHMTTDRLKPVKRQGNRLYVSEFRSLPEQLDKWRIGYGAFFEFTGTSIEEIRDCLTEKIQTVTAVGMDVDMLERRIRITGCAGVDRVVPAGEALEFDLVWDRKNLLKELSL